MVRRWTYSTHGGLREAGDHGVEFSNPVVVENLLVFGNRSMGLVCLYPALNQKKWVLPITGGIVSPLVVEKGNVYFGGGDGFVYSVSLDTGQINWKYEVRNPVVSRPTFSQGRLFVTTTSDTIYALDAGTGKWIWHYRRRTVPSATVYGASSPLVDGNEVIAGLSDGFLVSLSLEEGVLRWEKKLHSGKKFTDVNAHPLLDFGMIYVPSYDGALYALRRQGGDILWKFDAGGGEDLAADDRRLYFPSSNGTVYSIQKSNGALLWKFELDKGTPTAIALTEKYLIVGSSYQYLYVLDRNTGKGLYRFDAGWGSGFYGAPAYDSVNQRVYILSAGGNHF